MPHWSAVSRWTIFIHLVTSEANPLHSHNNNSLKPVCAIWTHSQSSGNMTCEVLLPTLWSPVETGSWCTNGPSEDCFWFMMQILCEMQLCENLTSIKTKDGRTEERVGQILLRGKQLARNFPPAENSSIIQFPGKRSDHFKLLFVSSSLSLRFLILRVVVEVWLSCNTI